MLGGQGSEAPDQGREARPVDQLEHEITRLRNKIVAKRHERWALSASCVVMVTLGAVMAMYLKLTTPLIIYLWSFFPALGTIIVMEAGGQTIASRGPVGLPLLWSGVIALAVLAAIVYRRMTRL